ncbi:c-type cytochrome, partial [Parapedobacter sp.]
PDGTEMEVYTHGMRNIYDVAIDPLMNMFTRDNTNDGGGWNIRFSHQLQSGEYGYPLLFKHYTEEIIPALVDVGGGSGTGSLFLNDHRWPDAYNNTPLMADWGRSYLYRHPVTADGPTYTQSEEPFIQLPQITDVDIDGSGIMYLSAWDGAGYSGSPDIGYVVRVVPDGWEYQPFADVTQKSERQLIALLESPDAKARQAAQFELLSRDPGERVASSVWERVEDGSLDKPQRVAALYTYAQLAGKAGVDRLVEATRDTALQESALRALADRKGLADAVPAAPFLTALQSDNPRIRAAATIGVGRLGIREAIDPLLSTEVPASFKAPALGTEGPHATPNAEIIIPHLSVRALVALDAVAECIDALGTEQTDMALWAMRYFHDDRVVDALIGAYDHTEDAVYRGKIINTLARIYHREPAYDASWWWGTRPDTHGPYYKTEEWSSTPAIRGFLITQWEAADKTERESFSALNTKYRLGIDRFGTVDLEKAREAAAKVDLEAIKNKKGQVGESSIEDVLLALQQIKGDPEAGAALFAKQGCVACHTVDASGPMKGPFMGQIGSIMNREKIAESILKPNASISQGFATVQIELKNGDMHVGFVTAESADKITINNIAGVATEIKTADIKDRQELEMSMMPEGLANALSYEELASLVAYLEKQK